MEATVAKLKKNNSAEVWVCLRDYMGRQFVDVREHLAEIEKAQRVGVGAIAVAAAHVEAAPDQRFGLARAAGTR